MSTRRCVTIVNLTSNKVGRFWRIARQLPEVEFLAVLGGYGPQVLPRRIPANVTVLDHVPADRMDELVWARTAIVLAPSRTESWGMGTSEALTLGIPVLAHPATGLLESLGYAGLFIDRRDFREWGRVIRRLLTDPRAYRRRSLLCRRRGVELVAQSREHLSGFLNAVERIAHV